MTFALAVLILPKQMLWGQNAEISCCDSSKKTDKECCDDQEPQKPCHDSEDSNSCGDNCASCSSCHFHTAVYTASAKNGVQAELSVNIFSRTQFKYLAPQIQDISAKIWQPPKIG